MGQGTNAGTLPLGRHDVVRRHVRAPGPSPEAGPMIEHGPTTPRWARGVWSYQTWSVPDQTQLFAPRRSPRFAVLGSVGFGVLLPLEFEHEGALASQRDQRLRGVDGRGWLQPELTRLANYPPAFLVKSAVAGAAEQQP